MPKNILRNEQLQTTEMNGGKEGEPSHQTLSSSMEPAETKQLAGQRRRKSQSSSARREALGTGEESLKEWQVMMHIFNASIGPGILAMPSAVRDAGLLVGSLGVLLVALLIAYTMQLLIRSAQFVRDYYALDGEHFDLDYAETVRQTVRFAFGPDSRMRHLAKYLQFCLIVSQIGFLAVYLMFVSETIKVMVDHYDPPGYRPPLIVYQVCLWVLFIPLVFVKTLKKLAVLSSFSNILGLLSLLTIIIYSLSDLKPVTQYRLVKTFDTIPLFFGVVVFSFESINVLLPVENKMQEKSAMLGFGGVLNVTMIFVVALFTSVGFYGYLCFGEAVQGSVIYSMPMSPWYVMISKPMYALFIFISYALEFYIVFTIIWESLDKHLTAYSPRCHLCLDALLRIGIVTLSFVLAAAVPHIELMISLIGAFAVSSLAILFPTLLDTFIICQTHRRRSNFPFLVAKNAGIFCVGIAGTIIGTYTSIIAIIETFKKV